MSYSISTLLPRAPSCTTSGGLGGKDFLNALKKALDKKAIRAAFDDRSIRRGIIVAEGNYIACQTWIEGTFLREFTDSPAGPLPPNGQRVVWDL